MERRSSAASCSQDVLAVDADGAGGRVDHPVDHAQRRRLAATGRSDEDGHAPFRHLKGEVVDRGCAVREALVDRIELDHEESLARLHIVMQSSR